MSICNKQEREEDRLRAEESGLAVNPKVSSQYIRNVPSNDGSVAAFKTIRSERSGVSSLFHLQVVPN